MQEPVSLNPPSQQVNPQEEKNPKKGLLLLLFLFTALLFGGLGVVGGKMLLCDKDSESEQKMTCFYAEIDYSDSDTFDSEDGCNKCLCNDGVVICTKLICETEESTNNENTEKSTITKIIYEFTDSSVPPEYHRSYVITVTNDTVQVVVDSYGEILAEKEINIEATEFTQLIDSLKTNDISNKSETNDEDGYGCAGGTTDRISFYSEEKEIFEGSNYNCGGGKYGNLDGNVSEFVKDIKSMIPNFINLLE